MRVGLAVGLVCASALVFSVVFAGVKLLGPGYSPLQVLLLRYGIGLIVSLPLLVRAGRQAWWTDRPITHATRALWGVLATLCLFYAITRMPLATVTALSFSMPLFLTALSAPLLGERVGWRRITATVVGFLGVLLVVNPTAGLNWIALVALAGALFYALAVVSIRQLSSSEPAVRIFFYYTMANISLCGMTMPWLWVKPSPRDWLIFLMIGTLGTVGQYCFIAAYRYAPASVIAPFDYSQLLFALLIGLTLWGELPAISAFIGGALIMLSGLYIWWRERQRF